MNFVYPLVEYELELVIYEETNFTV